MKNLFDVGIIGAGPAGLSAAFHLSKQNLSVVVFEQKKEIGVPVCCGEAISKYSLESFEFFDTSYIDKKVKGFKIFFPNKKFFYVNSAGYILNRDKFEKFIYEKIKDKIKIYLSTRIYKIFKENLYFKITSKNNYFFCKFLIGADGPTSLVDNLFFKNSVKLLDTIQFKIKKENFDIKTDSFLHFYYDDLSNYYFWLFEKQKEINIGCMGLQKNFLSDFIKKNYGEIDLKNKIIFSHGKIPISWIKGKIYKENVFLIGDAAGLVNPVSFAGIYSALLSGQICANSIISYLKTSNKKYLDNYESQIKSRFYSPFLYYISKHCYSFPKEILNFIGEYFDGANFRKKDFIKFFKLSFYNPIIFKYLLPLIIHREILRYKINELW